MSKKITIVVMGAGGVGKSCLCYRLAHQKFNTHYDPTIEDVLNHNMRVDGISVELNLLDTAGQEEYIAQRDQWIREGQAFLLVYSLTSENSSENVEEIYRQIMRIRGDEGSIPVVIVGNKKDLAKEGQNASQLIQKNAKEWDVPCLETSAKTGENVVAVFEKLIRGYWAANKIDAEKLKKEANSNPNDCCCIL